MTAKGLGPSPVFSERLDQLAAEGNLSPDVIEVIRAQHEDRLKHIGDRNTGTSGKHGELHDEIERLLIAAERKRINDHLSER